MVTDFLKYNPVIEDNKRLKGEDKTNTKTRWIDTITCINQLYDNGRKHANSDLVDSFIKFTLFGIDVIN